MDAIYFGLKRAYQATLKVGRFILSRIGLTPARFDMIYAIRHSGRTFMTQMELRRVLGVSRPTVSRMLASLEKLGLVWRGPTHDRRTRKVDLTPAGERLLKRVLDELIAPEILSFPIDDALTHGRSLDENVRFLKRAYTESTLNILARYFRDTATLYYPWGFPDD